MLCARIGRAGRVSGVLIRFETNVLYTYCILGETKSVLVLHIFFSALVFPEFFFRMVVEHGTSKHVGNRRPEVVEAFLKYRLFPKSCSGNGNDATTPKSASDYAEFSHIVRKGLMRVIFEILIDFDHF